MVNAFDRLMYLQVFLDRYLQVHEMFCFKITWMSQYLRRISIPDAIKINLK